MIPSFLSLLIYINNSDRVLIILYLFTMINSLDFAKRLETVIDYFGETASSFSDKIGVQRSSISHIISGRNKPSLDFIMKILSAYPEVELYWLVNGKGNSPSTNKPEIKSGGLSKHTEITKENNFQGACAKPIERIVIFYEDGTFKNYLSDVEKS